MSIRRILAIGLIFCATWAGWLILGMNSSIRSGEFGEKLRREVAGLWGRPLTQQAPKFYTKIPGTTQTRPVSPEANDIQAELVLKYRRKGLLWYSFYECHFIGCYTIKNMEPVAANVYFDYHFPDSEGTYDNFQMTINGEARDNAINPREGVADIIRLAPGDSKTLIVSYKTRGLERWSYKFDSDVGRINDLDCMIKTNFDDVDFGSNSLSPNTLDKKNGTCVMNWKAEKLITSHDICVVAPQKINPGPLAAKITYFAPVCLIFFFVLIATIGIMCEINIHPMHYLFVSSGFFAFHLLFSYLIGLINVHVAFFISALVTLLLVNLYMRTALGPRFPWKFAFIGQLFYLILFSYSFFFEGLTGLVVTIGSIVTLAILMAVTAKVDWSNVYSRRAEKVRRPASVEMT